jgi:hypothetical protein
LNVKERKQMYEIKFFKVLFLEPKKDATCWLPAIFFRHPFKPLHKFCQEHLAWDFAGGARALCVKSFAEFCRPTFLVWPKILDFRGMDRANH